MKTLLSRRAPAWAGALGVLVATCTSCATARVAPNRQLEFVPTRAVAAGLVPPAPPLSAEAGEEIREGRAKVQVLRGGRASVSTDGRTWQTLAIAAVVKPGATVRTEAGAVADLYLGYNGPVIRLLEHTTLKLETLRWTKSGRVPKVETRLVLERGRIYAGVRLASPDSSYEIVTPGGVYRARQAELELSWDGEIRVRRGQVTHLLAPESPGARRS